MRYPTRQTGFTLIEVLIVIVVIGILSSIATVAFLSVQRDSRDGQREAKITSVTEALEKYYEKNGEYPSVARMRSTDGATLATYIDLRSADALVMPQASSTTNSFTGTAPSPTSIVYTGSESTATCTTDVNGGCLHYTITWAKESDTATTITVTSRR